HSKQLSDTREQTIVSEGKEMKTTFIVGGSCGLCHEDKNDAIDKNVIVMKCSHSFHKSCIKIWKDSGLKCPHCKEDLEEI
ncbi:MAG: hypothetical protein EZS28_053772, partial [Streblomastix strix]